MELQEVLTIPFQMEDFKAKIDGKELETQLGLPDTETLKAALEHEELAETIKAFSAYGFRSFLRNSLKANRGNFTSFADVLRIQAEAAEAKGGNTEALALRQAFIKAFADFLEAKAMKARGVKLLTGLVKSPASLTVAQPAMVERLAAELDEYQASEGYEAAYDTVMAKLADNISEALQGDDEDADLF